jgi:hypothetical protein
MTTNKIKIRGMINIRELITNIKIADILSGMCLENLRCKGEKRKAINAAIHIVPKKGSKKRKATTAAANKIIVQLG